ncbi:related to CTA1-catalase A, peroxisomal [Fusarium fujikuroi]|nr:related to CTA1-catalase A, peroxisomal [Fusarium fujikuroi]
MSLNSNQLDPRQHPLRALGNAMALILTSPKLITQASCSSTITELPKDGASTTATDAKPIGDLWGAVEKGEEIERTAHVLVMDPKQADPDKLGFDPFDVTKAAFSPSSMVPGIEDSPDPLLQFHVFFYRDAQYRRIGVNLHPTASLTSSELVSLRRRIRSATTSQAGLVTVDLREKKNTRYNTAKGLRRIKLPRSRASVWRRCKTSRRIMRKAFMIFWVNIRLSSPKSRD